MDRPTLFTWGYYGWGNHTPHLVEAVDAVETSRGFQPPLFVDIRIRRNVRAKGFVGTAFENELGPSRHRWMKSLGNKFIQSRSGPNIQIAEPAAADELLDLTLEAAGRKQRVLFFCSCQWPKCDGEIACHRTTVAGLVLNTAQKRGVAIEIVEWPGGTPTQKDVEVSKRMFDSVRKGRMTVPLGNEPNLAEFAGLPWCSIATVRSGDQKVYRIAGPAIRQNDQWAWPVFPTDLESEASSAHYENEASKIRQRLGLDQQRCDGGEDVE